MFEGLEKRKHKTVSLCVLVYFDVIFAQRSYHTLSWVLSRCEPLSHLHLESTVLDDAHEMKPEELSLFRDLASGIHTGGGLRFWATSSIIQLLCVWGVCVSMFLHSCPCHLPASPGYQTCRLKGRQCVALASGRWKGFVDSLKDVSVDVSSGGLQAALFLQKLRASSDEDAEIADWLLTEMENCKRVMLFRCEQAWGFWDFLPWKTLSLIQHVVYDNASEKDSLNEAMKLSELFSSSTSKSKLGSLSWSVFDARGDMNPYLVTWLTARRDMPLPLKRKLLGYGMSLIVMQRLEAKHHYLHTAVSQGRAVQTPALIALLRRQANNDLVDPDFRCTLQTLLESFHDLVPQRWQSFQDLLRIVYGYGLEQLHQDKSTCQNHLQRYRERLAKIKGHADDPEAGLTWENQF